MLETLRDKLISNNFTLSCAESVTGGLFAQTLTSIPKSSVFFLGGIVSYSNRIKESILQIPHQIIINEGVVSSQVALLMASNVKNLFKSDVAISFTGNAGPDVLEQKPIGLNYVGIITPKQTVVEKIQYDQNWTRNQIQNAAVEWVINFLNKNL